MSHLRALTELLPWQGCTVYMHSSNQQPSQTKDQGPYH